MSVKERNYGIDLLRILSMFMVLLGHFNGVLMKSGSINFNSPSYVPSGIIQGFIICAVDVFAIITGFVCLNTRFKLDKIIKMWLQVVFWLVVGNVYLMISGKATLGNVLRAFMPISLGSYWYFTAYFILFFFMPFFNILINKMTKQQHISLILVFFAFFMCHGWVFDDSWLLNGGFNYIWISCLYFVGAFFSKYGFPKIKSKYWCLIYFCIVLIFMLYDIVNRTLFVRYLGEIKRIGWLKEYISPFVVLQAISLFCIFSKLDIKSKGIVKFIRVLAPAAFGVYLIHSKFFIYNEMFPYFQFLNNKNPILYLFAVIGIAVLIYIICSALELIRIKLFAITLDKPIGKLSKWFTKCYKLIIDKIS